jgi:hypothetical protein
MDRLTIGPDTRRKRHIAWLFVGQARFHIPQAIGSLVSFRSDCATMPQLTGHWRGERHAGRKDRIGKPLDFSITGIWDSPDCARPHGVLRLGN